MGSFESEELVMNLVLSNEQFTEIKNSLDSKYKDAAKNRVSKKYRLEKISLQPTSEGRLNQDAASRKEAPATGGKLSSKKFWLDCQNWFVVNEYYLYTCIINFYSCNLFMVVNYNWYLFHYN